MLTAMPLQSEENRPQSCFDVGLNCRDCSAENARQVARACKGLRGKAISQLFVQIYSDPACAPMHAHFAAAYREASGDAPPKPMGVAVTVRSATAAA
jgi:hypothetical protein